MKTYITTEQEVVNIIRFCALLQYFMNVWRYMAYGGWLLGLMAGFIIGRFG